MGDAWAEEDHPRDPDGKFAGAGGVAGLKAWAGKGQGPRQWTDTPTAGLRSETWSQHFSAHPDEGGRPSDERSTSVHEPIVHEALDKVAPVAPGEQKIAIMTMGGPGSGKSAMMEGVDKSAFVHVDPDAVREQLPEYREGIAASYRGSSAQTHEEVSYVSKQILARAIAEGKHVLIDGTGKNGPKFVQQIKDLKAAGYEVRVNMAHLTAAQALPRIEARAEKTGRDVPRELVKAAYDKIPKNFQEVSKVADRFKVYDTSRRDSPVVWSKGPAGEVHHDRGFVERFKKEHF